MRKTRPASQTTTRMFADGSALATALRQDIEDTILAVIADPVPGLSVFKAPAGAGKSGMLCELLARHGAALLQRGHVVFHLPTNELAEQMAMRFAATGSALPVLALRGRGAFVDGEPLCIRNTIAQRLGGVAPSVRAALCDGEGPDGTPAVAACREGCRWWAQFPPSPEARIVFTSHAYLTLPLPIPGPVALRVVDETFWEGLCTIGSIPLEMFLCGGPAPEGRTALRLIKARATVYEALMAGTGVMGALRRRRITPEELAQFAALEEQAVEPPAVSPSMTVDEQTALLDTFDLAAFRAARRRAAIWRVLAETPARRETQRLTLTAVTDPKSGARRMRMTLHGALTLPRDAPLIAIDADADHAILAALAPDMVFRAYAAPALAAVVQAVDLTMSKQHLLDPHKGRARRDAVRRVIAGEVAMAPNGRVLLVTNHSILEALHKDAGTPGTDPDRLRQKLEGADCRWFGPSIRGTDTFASHDTVVVLGRHEQRPETIDGLMRCLWGLRERKGMPFLGGGQHRVSTDLVTRTGETKTVTVASHPAPEGRAILAQLREATTAQAAARLRPIFPSGPKRILLLSSLPIPSLHVDQLLGFGDLACRRLFAALEEARWEPMLLTPRGLADMAPKTFGSLDAAECWLKRLGGVDALHRNLVDLAAQQGLDVAVKPWKPEGRRGQAPLRAVFRTRDVSIGDFAGCDAKEAAPVIDAGSADLAVTVLCSTESAAASHRPRRVA